MSTNAKRNTGTLMITAALALIVASPSWAGERDFANPSAGGGMGFGPMTMTLIDVARTTAPLRGEEAVTAKRGEVALAGAKQMPASPQPAATPPEPAVHGANVAMARKSY